MKIRGTASHIAEKYVQLARDAQSSGDPVAAENYYQHAEHYFRLIAAAQEQFRQSQPFYQQQSGPPGVGDDGYDDDDGEQPSMGGEPFAPRDSQPFYQQHAPHQQSQQPPARPQQHAPPSEEQDVERLPSFITGGQQPASPPQGQAGNGPNGPHNPNGPNGYDGSADRFPLHRRRRRHRGPRDHSLQGGGEGEAPLPSTGPLPTEE